MPDSTTTSSTPSETSPESETEIARTVIGGTEWVELLSDSQQEPELEGNQGICHMATQRLLLNRNEVPSRGYSAVRFHEQFHASARQSGAVLGLQMILGVDADKMEEIEEYIVSAWGQAMFDTLYRNGYLKY